MDERDPLHKYVYKLSLDKVANVGQEIKEISIAKDANNSLDKS